MLTIAQASEILGVNKKTLMRWDASGKFPSKREGIIRYYDEKDIQQHAQWFKLRRKHKEHNRKLGAIRKEVDRFTATQPLGPFDNPHFHKYEDMKRAYDALRAWEQEDKKILEEYSQLPSGFKAKVDPES